MIKETKSLVSDLVAAITPASLCNNETVAMDVTGSYDWNTQSYNYDACKFGTYNQTSSQTRSNFNAIDDNNLDSIGD